VVVRVTRTVVGDALSILSIIAARLRASRVGEERSRNDRARQASARRLHDRSLA
jgi:hypothetical protein